EMLLEESLKVSRAQVFHRVAFDGGWEEGTAMIRRHHPHRGGVWGEGSKAHLGVSLIDVHRLRQREGGGSDVPDAIAAAVAASPSTLEQDTEWECRRHGWSGGEGRRTVFRDGSLKVRGPLGCGGGSGGGEKTRKEADPSYERCQVLNWELRSLVLEAGSYVWSPATLDKIVKSCQNVSRPRQIGGDWGRKKGKNNVFELLFLHPQSAVAILP
ncbi:5453_t:CDS:2, partial [Acaulospora colombiana]